LSKTYSLSDFHHQTSINVRFRDLDILNHVNNAVFSTYFEEARIRFIQAIPEFNKSMSEGHSFVLVHLDLNFLKPVLYGDDIIIGSSIKSIGNSSVTGIQAIFSGKDQTVKAVAETTGVWFNLKQEKPAKLPEISNLDQYIYTKTDG